VGKKGSLYTEPECLATVPVGIMWHGNRVVTAQNPGRVSGTESKHPRCTYQSRVVQGVSPKFAVVLEPVVSHGRHLVLPAAVILSEVVSMGHERPPGRTKTSFVSVVRSI
jgi:hypothetical protein